MGKFKVGDRVKRIERCAWPDEFGVVGEEYTVLSVYDYGCIEVIKGKKSDGAKFELVPAWQPKVGDRVRCVKTYEGAFTAGNQYTVAYFEPTEPRLGVERDDSGEPNGIGASYFGPITTPAITTPTIVALIESGQLKPSTSPKVHPDQESAITEAERLALQFPGQQFGIFVLADSKIADVVNVPTPVLRAA